jgi:hypothetical protein
VGLTIAHAGLFLRSFGAGGRVFSSTDDFILTFIVFVIHLILPAIHHNLLHPGARGNYENLVDDKAVDRIEAENAGKLDVKLDKKQAIPAAPLPTSRPRVKKVNPINGLVVHKILIVVTSASNIEHVCANVASGLEEALNASLDSGHSQCVPV